MKFQRGTWAAGEFFLGFAYSADERSLELHLGKLILKVKFRPAPVNG